MSLTTLIIIAVICFVITIIFYANDVELFARIMLIPTAIAVVMILAILFAGKTTVNDSETKEFNIEDMYYDDSGYLTKLIDDKGNEHLIREFKGCDTIRTVSITEDNKISYTEKTENITIKFLFVYANMERVICETKLPKDTYYDYVYGKDSNIVPAK